MATDLRQMREMIAQLMQGQKGSVPPPSSNEDPISPDVDDAAAKAAAEAAAKAAEEDLGGEETSDSTKKGDKQKNYNETPWYSLYPPIPHPHINHRGDPPKMCDYSFAQWQFLMKSHV